MGQYKNRDIRILFSIFPFFLSFFKFMALHEFRIERVFVISRKYYDTKV